MGIKIRLSKLKFLIGGLFIVVGLVFVVFTWFFGNANEREQVSNESLVLEGGAIFFPDRNVRVDATERNEQSWEFDYVQPVVSGFETVDGVHYLLFRFTDDQGEIHQGKALLAGAMGLWGNLEKIHYRDEIGLKEVTFEELQELIVQDDQIGIEYVSNTSWQLPLKIDESVVCAGVWEICQRMNYLYYEESGSSRVAVDILEQGVKLSTTLLYSDLYNE